MESATAAARWATELVAALQALDTTRLLLITAGVCALAVAAATLLGRVVDLVGVLVRGHAPAEVDVAELVEVLGRIEDALGERGHLAGCIGDVYTATDGLVDAHRVATEDRLGHYNRVEELLAQLLAATRATTVAVQVLDGLADPYDRPGHAEGTDPTHPPVDDDDAELDRLRAELTTTRKG